MIDEPSRVAAWLQYFADLGISSTYRDRRAGPGFGRETFKATSRGDSSGPQSGTVLASNERLRDPITASPLPARTVLAAHFAGSRSVVSLSPTLFEAADRVEDDTFEKIRETIGDCRRCRLHEHRTNIVFGVGSPRAQLVFIGEGPGRDEDIQGEPFVGRAGKLLTQMIEAMGLRREDVYICNVVKCRPPENRTPEKDEMATCSQFLFRQLDVIRPKAIVCLGAVAVQALLGAGTGITKTRGQWFDFRGARLMPTYHPAYLLRNPAAKTEVWKDLQQVMAFLGLEPARVRRSPQPRA
jgi:uracil-DNA glycosylase family 4